MGNGLFGASLSGMSAAQFGLTTTEHNIANAGTLGYTRQVVETASRNAQQTGAGFVGQGVNVTGVKRIYDQFLSTQLLQEQAQASYLTSYATSLRQIDNLIADPAAGASPAMQQLFDAMNGVASNPESIPSRQAFISSAQYAVNRFQAIDQRFTEISDGINGQITSTVSAINSYAQQIAVLNGNIKRATAASSQGALPNDMLDQRDQLISLLNNEVKATVLRQPDGTTNIFIGTGQALVVDENTYGLQAVQSPSDSSKLEIAYNINGQQAPIQQSNLQGGTLGAYLVFRDQTLEPARNALGRVALGLADRMNQQNQMGLDLSGVLGGNLFTMAAPRISPAAINTGGATMTGAIVDVNLLTTSDYQLRFDGTTYSMLRLSDNMVTDLGIDPAALPAVDGFQVTLTSGALAAGDSFLIRPTANGASGIGLAISEPAKIAAAAPIRGAAALTNIGTGRISSGTVNPPLPLNPDLQRSISITFSDPAVVPQTYTVDDVTDPLNPFFVDAQNYVAGQDITYNGWTVNITGIPAAGDVFTVSPNTNATGDNRNALLLAGLQNQNTLSNGTATFQAAYGQLVGLIGTRTHEMDVTSLAQTNMVNETLKQQQAVSGVNLDEEAANLIRFQKAYQASAKAMQIASTLFDELLALGR
ncbi:MAG: flagellar hook-associated protein FlgK [Gallionella sp.]|jgi:flagellar hook-associated protein 1 FlgK|nr:flagellar hook-associated protein FlgK [Gallionella sp.]MCK9354970.1 flagellar hook-associated protein FlgK [Gallionella sp.]